MDVSSYRGVKRRDRRRSCSRKRRFESKTDACAAAAALFRATGERCRAYQCRYGDHFHIGHSWRHRMPLVAIAAFVFLTAPLAAEEPERVSFACARSGHGSFRCIAKDHGPFVPEWRLYSSPTYFATGPSASFPAPEEWSRLEMRLEDAIQTHVLTAWVRKLGRKVIFTPKDPSAPVGEP